MSDPGQVLHDQKSLALPQPTTLGEPGVPVAFFDLDGTIRYSKSGKYIDGPEDVALFDHVGTQLWRLRQHGYRCVGVTNQGGVAFGYKTEDEARAEIEATSGLFVDDPFCLYLAATTHPDAEGGPRARRSQYRKPAVGMVMEAARLIETDEVHVDWARSVMVGDRGEDLGCATRAGISFEWAWTFFHRDPPEGTMERLSHAAGDDLTESVQWAGSIDDLLSSQTGEPND